MSVERLERGVAEDERGDDRDLVGLEQVGRHTGAVADVVTDVVGDGGGVAGVVLGDTCLDLADEVSADVSGLGEDAAPDPHEQSEERGAEAEADEDGGGRVLEDEDDPGRADDAEADAEHAGDPSGAERDFESAWELTVPCRCRGADVAAHGDRHADEASDRRECRADEEGDGAGEAGLHECQGDMAVRLDDLLRREEDEHEQRDHDDRDGPELPLQEGDRAFLDRGRDLAHRLGALVRGEHAAHQVQRYQDRDDSSGKGEAQPGALGTAECECLVAARAREEVGGHQSAPLLRSGGRINESGPQVQPRPVSAAGSSVAAWTAERLSPRLASGPGTER